MVVEKRLPFPEGEFDRKNGEVSRAESAVVFSVPGCGCFYVIPGQTDYP